MASYCILIRHSLPEIVPELPPDRWQLSPEGRIRCQPLAQELTAYLPLNVVSSREPKAQETAELLASRLGLAYRVAENLHEHEGRHYPLLNREQFEALVFRFFASPQQLIMGSETADQAHRRFATAVAAVCGSGDEGNFAIVSHGTVISLLVARANGLDPFRFWKSLGLPSLIVLSWPQQRIVWRARCVW